MKFKYYYWVVITPHGYRSGVSVSTAEFAAKSVVGEGEMILSWKKISRGEAVGIYGEDGIIKDLEEKLKAEVEDGKK